MLKTIIEFAKWLVQEPSGPAPPPERSASMPVQPSGRSPEEEARRRALLKQAKEEKKAQIDADEARRKAAHARRAELVEATRRRTQELRAHLDDPKKAAKTFGPARERELRLQTAKAATATPAPPPPPPVPIPAAKAPLPPAPAAPKLDWRAALDSLGRSPEEIELERQLWADDLPSNQQPGRTLAKQKPTEPAASGQSLPRAIRKSAKPTTKATPRKPGRAKTHKPAVAIASLLDCCVIYDLETTGLRSADEHIIQIGAAKVRGGRVIERFSRLIKPPITIPAFIEDYTGITNRAVRNAPRAIEVIRAFSGWAGQDLLIAHNGNRFDKSFLRAELERAGEPMREVLGFDSLSLAKLLHPVGTSKGMDALADYYGVSLDGRRHEAGADVAMLHDILVHMVTHAAREGHASAPAHPVWLSAKA